MDLTDLIGPEDIYVPMKASCKKQVLQDLAEFASAKTGIGGNEIFRTLLEREKLGSTGIGHGIAIPHGRLDKLKNVIGFAAILDKPVDFESVDDEPVDVVFMLLAPTESNADHLKALARVARVLREPEMLKSLRNADSRQSAFHLLANAQTPHAA